MKRGKRRAANATPDIKRAAELSGLRGPNTAGNYSTCCPFCLLHPLIGSEDTKFKLTIKLSGETKTTKIPLRPDSGAFNCYRCGTSGLGDFSWIEDMVGPVAAPPAPTRPDLGPPAGFEAITKLATSSVRAYYDYFARRGVLTQALAVGAGACRTGRFAGRVVVPSKDASGEWLGFSARAVDDREPKYLYPAGMNRREMLWGVEHLPAGNDPVYVVEGVFDWLPLYPFAVATLGKNVTDEQLERLVALGRPIVSCLDGDAWILARALAARVRLRGREAAWCRLPPGMDPGKLGWDVARYLELPK